MHAERSEQNSRALPCKPWPAEPALLLLHADQIITVCQAPQLATHIHQVDMDPLQRLLSLGLVQGATTAAGADQVRLSADGAAPELQSLLARLAERLTADPGAAAEAAEQQPRPQQTASRAALDCLEQERQRLEAAAEAQRRRNAASSQRAQACCARAGEQHAAVGSAVQALADCLVPLAASEPGALPLLCVAVPDEVAGGGRALLQSLAERVGCEAGAAGAGHSERAHEQSQRRLQQEEEFARLQAALRLTASAKVQAQAGVARCVSRVCALCHQVPAF